MKKIFLVILVALIVMSCKKDNDDVNPVPAATLQTYIDENSNLEQEILIACAASEPESNTDFDISVFFYPYHGAQDYRYFESASADIDEYDFTNYKEIEWETLPVFNGYLRRFPHPGYNDERWGIVTYLTDGRLHVCDPIRLKQITKPILYAPEKLEIDISTPTEPEFSWEDDNDPENIIYFQVVSDSAGNLISGTYTYDKHWKFYDLSNVVLNIKEQDPSQVLHPNRTYNFTLMGVSEDNWVNLVCEKSFITN